jgi:phage terminase large subunit-like protein
MSTTALSSTESLNKRPQTGCLVELSSQNEEAPLSYPSPPQDHETVASTGIQTSEPDLAVHDGDFSIPGVQQPSPSSGREELKEECGHIAPADGLISGSLDSINTLQFHSAWTDTHERVCSPQPSNPSMLITTPRTSSSPLPT